MSTPDKHGWRQCHICGVWQRPESLVCADYVTLPGDVVVHAERCDDEERCRRFYEANSENEATR